MSIKYKSNLCGGILSVALAIILFVLIPQQIGVDPASTSTTGVDSRTVPYAMAVLILVCGIFRIIQSVVLKKDTVDELVLSKERLALVYVVCLVVFSVLYKYSFILATCFLGLITLVLLKCKKPLYYIIELAVVVALYFIFTQLLGVRLPALFL